MEKFTSEMKDSDRNIEVGILYIVIAILICACVGLAWWQRTKSIPSQAFLMAQYLCIHNEKVNELRRGWEDKDWVIKCNNGAEFRNVTIDKVEKKEVNENGASK